MITQTDKMITMYTLLSKHSKSNYFFVFVVVTSFKNSIVAILRTPYELSRVWLRQTITNYSTYTNHRIQ